MKLAHAQAAVSLLQFSPGAGNAWKRLEHLRENEWLSLLAWLDRSGISLYFWRKIKELKLQDTLRPSIRAQFEKRENLNTIRSQAMLAEWRTLQNLFRSAHIDCVVLKGLAKAPDYCPDPALRIQFDHDWLIDRTSLSRAEDLLRSANYQKKPIRENDRVVYLQSEPQFERSWRPADSYLTDVQRPVELHLDIWDCEYENVFLDLPRDLADRSVSRRWLGDEFRSLCDEDVLIFEVLHAFRHIIHNWCRISVLYEIAHFLGQRSSDRSFWLRFKERIQGSLKLRRITGVIFALTESLFKPPALDRAISAEFFALTSPLRLWVVRYGMPSAIENFSTDKFSLFLLGEFVDQRDKWRAIRKRRLFPIGIPHRVRNPAKRSESGGPASTVRAGMFYFRRLGFHLHSALSYAWECPRWHHLKRRGPKGLLSCPLPSALQVEARRPDFSSEEPARDSPVQQSRSAMCE